MLHDAFAVPSSDHVDFENELSTSDVEKFYKLINDSQQELYPGC